MWWRTRLSHAEAIRAAMPGRGLSRALAHRLRARCARRLARRPATGADRRCLRRDWLDRTRRRARGGGGRRRHIATAGHRGRARRWPTGRPGLAARSRPDSRRVDGPAVLEVDGWRLGLAICKDTGVPRTCVGHRVARDRRLRRRDVRNRPRTRGDRTSERVASPSSTTSGWRSRASPGRRVAGTPTRPALRDLVGGRVARLAGRRDARRDRARHARGLTPGPIHRSNQACVARIAASAACRLTGTCPSPGNTSSSVSQPAAASAPNSCSACPTACTGRARRR